MFDQRGNSITSHKRVLATSRPQHEPSIIVLSFESDKIIHRRQPLQIATCFVNYMSLSYGCISHSLTTTLEE